MDGAILGATQGITQIGINYLADELELPPIVQQMSSQVLNSLVPGIASTISHAVRSFSNSTLTTGNKPYKSDPKYQTHNEATGQYEFNLDAYASDMANWSWEDTGYKQMSKSL